MTSPVPYDQYDKSDVRSLLDSLPLDADGMRVGLGMQFSFIVQIERHTRARTLLTARVRAISDDGRLFFDHITNGSLVEPHHGVMASEGWLNHDHAIAAYAERSGPRLDKTA